MQSRNGSAGRGFIQPTGHAGRADSCLIYNDRNLLIKPYICTAFLNRTPARRGPRAAQGRGERCRPDSIEPDRALRGIQTFCLDRLESPSLRSEIHTHATRRGAGGAQAQLCTVHFVQARPRGQGLGLGLWSVVWPISALQGVVELCKV
jgi:hypothetical protein